MNKKRDEEMWNNINERKMMKEINVHHQRIPRSQEQCHSMKEQRVWTVQKSGKAIDKAYKVEAKKRLRTLIFSRMAKIQRIRDS